MRVPGISATISITGGMNLCADSTEKFAGTPASAASAAEEWRPSIVHTIRVWCFAMCSA